MLAPRRAPGNGHRRQPPPLVAGGSLLWIAPRGALAGPGTMWRHHSCGQCFLTETDLRNDTDLNLYEKR